MLSTTLRAARPLGTRLPNLAIGNQARASTTRIPSSSRLNLKSVATGRPSPLAFRAHMSTKPPLQPNKIDKAFEREVAQKEIEARPNEVSSASTVRHVIESSQAPPENNPDVLEGVKGDLNTVKDTFALSSVPREAYALGLAGTLPYFATSLSTVFLSWNLNTEWPTQSNFINSFLFSHDAATHWMQILEPIQLGYGAVIISFLGAIHWGLELAEKRPAADRTRLRYGIGVLAPAVAWPTMLMPIEWALTTQFAAFCALYFVDSRATVKGWAPAWYGTYRFVLTAIVGTAIVISLIGRARVGTEDTRPSTAALKDRVKGKPSGSSQRRNWAKEEDEERARIKEEQEQEKKKKKEEEEEEEEERKKKEGEKTKPTKKEGAKSEAKAKGEKKEDAKESGENDQEGEKGGAADTSGKDEDQKKDRKRKEGGEKSDENKGGGERSKKDDEN